MKKPVVMRSHATYYPAFENVKIERFVFIPRLLGRKFTAMCADIVTEGYIYKDVIHVVKIKYQPSKGK